MMILNKPLLEVANTLLPKNVISVTKGLDGKELEEFIYFNLVNLIEREYHYLSSRLESHNVLCYNPRLTKSHLDVIPSKIRLLRHNFSIESFNHVQKLLKNIAKELSCSL